MNMITPKPTAFVSRAVVPGIAILRNADSAPCAEFMPASTSTCQVCVICTAWETPIAKITKGTRMDIGSMPMPSSLSVPSSHSTGSNATISATTVRLSERV